MVETQPSGRAAVRMIVVTLPAEIDVCNAHRLGEDIQVAFASGATTVVADMTATAFCDSGGIRALVLAAKRCAASGGELRVVPSPRVLRVMTLMGLNGWLTIYPSLHEASATGPVATSNAGPS
jgi:anti-sigma B factor antagonist